MARKIVVIGLDGATWRLLEPLMEQGVMPNLVKLKQAGVQAVLRSTMPPYTAPAWTTFATGVHPGKHGCYDFLLPTDNLEEFNLCNSTHIRTSTVYELLAEAGKRSILINLPNSYPPKLTSPTITDMLTIGDNCIWPESLKQRYPILRQYRLTPDESLQLKGKLTDYVADIIAVERGHMAAVQTLWENEPWDFFFYLFSSTDWISHALFDKLLAGSFPAGLELFRYIDQQLGWFMNQLPPDSHLYVLSDHGFKVYQHTFYFNKWLEQEGYLVTKTASAEKFHQAISRQDHERRQLQNKKRWEVNLNRNFMQRLGTIPLLERMARWSYHHIAKPFLPVRINLDIAIDFSKTIVCFPKGRTMTAMYINDGRKYTTGIPLTDASYQALRAEITYKLLNLRGPDGQPVTPRIYSQEDIYGQDIPERCPDLFYEFGDYWFVGQFHSTTLFVDEISNKHDSQGIFLAYGPGLRADVHLPEQSIADLAPTLLHDLGYAVPRYMDGQVMPVFQTDRPVRYRDLPLVPERRQMTELIEELKL